MFPAAPVAQAVAPIAPPVARPGGSNKKVLIGVALLVVGGGVIAAVALKGGGSSGGKGSSDALIDSTLAAMSDGAALEKLVAGNELQEQAIDCEGEKGAKMKDPDRIARRKKELREELDQAVTKLNVQKLAIDKVELAEPRAKDDIKKGQKLGAACTARVDLSERNAKIQAHGERDGKPVKVTGKIAMVSIDGRWYLTDAPELSAGGGDCASAVAHLFEATHLASDPAQVDKFRASFEARCESDHWSDNAIKCLGAVKNDGDSMTCLALLTDQQRDAVTKDLANAAKGGGASPSRVPPGCVEYEKLMTGVSTCEAMSQEGRDTLAKQLDRMRAAWSKLDPSNAGAAKAISDACQKGFEAMKPALAKLGC